MNERLGNTWAEAPPSPKGLRTATAGERQRSLAKSKLHTGVVGGWGGVFHSPPPEHLGEDAADAPQVHRRGVTGLQQHLRRSVPQRHHLKNTHSTELYLGRHFDRIFPLLDERTAPTGFTHMTTLTVAGVIFLCAPPLKFMQGMKSYLARCVRLKPGTRTRK